MLWIVLWRGLLHWLDLVILGLSHCFPMVPRFMLLSNLPAKKLAGKLQSFGQTHPLVPQLLLLSPLLHWLDLVLLSQTHPMQKPKLNLVLFHLIWFHLHQPGIASLLHWLDPVREMILGKLQSFSQTHLVHLSLGH